MKILLIALCLLIPVRAFAACDFDTADKVLLGAATVLLVSDWAQTRSVLSRAPDSDPYYENNPILGRHPSQASVNLYFASAVAGTWGASCLLSDPWRKFFLGGVVGLEVSVTAQNYRLFGTWGF